jgi:hypothetical protein
LMINNLSSFLIMFVVLFGIRFASILFNC